MIRYLSVVAGLMVLTGAISVVQAEEKAATETMPAALSSLQVDEAQVLSAAEAQRVRGQGCGGCPLSQVKQFAIAGQAAGVTTLLEGVFAQFEFVNADGLKVSGTFGGLETWISVQDGSLSIGTAGKAFQETFEFAGEFVQQFQQTY
jgi:hypothetical protein